MDRAEGSRWLVAAALGAVTLGAALTTGCQAQPRFGGWNPFSRAERTTFRTPHERMEELKRIADGAAKVDPSVRETRVRELAATLANESDALLREQTLATIARFRTPLSGRALLAGLSDQDEHVRRRCCELLSRWPVEGQAPALMQVAESDESLDVRLAAVRALGASGADKAMLLVALEDPNPAMQLAGVEAMRRTTGQDLGGDVAAYRALAKGEPLPAARPERTWVAESVGEWLPFMR